MGVMILMGLAWLGAIGYWQYLASVAKRDERWNRWRYCLGKRNAILGWTAALVAVAVAIYFS